MFTTISFCTPIGIGEAEVPRSSVAVDAAVTLKKVWHVNFVLVVRLADHVPDTSTDSATIVKLSAVITWPTLIVTASVAVGICVPDSVDDATVLLVLRLYVPAPPVPVPKLDTVVFAGTPVPVTSMPTVIALPVTVPVTVMTVVEIDAVNVLLGAQLESAE